MYYWWFTYYEGWSWVFAQIDRFSFVTSHAQITQNNKFVISLQYLKKEKSDEVDFCM